MFVVLFRWKLDEQHIQSFKEGWSEIIHFNVDKCGALGSRLHKASDGTWISYSQWPSKEHWLRSKESESYVVKARDKMREAILWQDEPLLMSPQLDHFVAMGIETNHAKF
ncbi:MULTISPECIES: antibiotic biosynthesis monooxygenase family protein [unclassified Agarivorans]|uniref:antibiotic biosynthesis monooxygenase family protein n=1 Tax=unclassified Agarivorans TaxID=2636026 RepID=UPI003D7D0913